LVQGIYPQPASSVHFPDVLNLNCCTGVANPEDVTNGVAVGAASQEVAATGFLTIHSCNPQSPEQRFLSVSKLQHG